MPAPVCWRNLLISAAVIVVAHFILLVIKIVGLNNNFIPIVSGFNIQAKNERV